MHLLLFVTGYVGFTTVNCCNMYFIMRNGVIVNKLIIGLTRELVWFCFQHWLPGRVIIEILLIVLE